MMMIFSMCYERKSRVSNDDAIWVTKYKESKEEKKRKGKFTLVKDVVLQQ